MPAPGRSSSVAVGVDVETAVERATLDVLEAGLGHVRRSPSDDGRVELIVRRPAMDQREVLVEAELDPDRGLAGDMWSIRRTPSTPNGLPHPDKQVTVMNARVAALVAVDLDRRPLAGDQLYIDLDISEANLPAGTRLQVGTAVLEVTAEPHLGCSKFSRRFGREALRFVNSPTGRALRLRGLNAKVVVGGTVRRGDVVRKLLPPFAPVDA